MWKRRSKKLVALATSLALVLGGMQGTETQAAKKASVQLNKKKVTLVKGKKVTLKVKKKNVKKIKSIKWASKNKAVASVSGKGVVKAKKKGSTKVTALVKYQKKGSSKVLKKKLTCSVKVTDKKQVIPSTAPSQTPSGSAVASNVPASQAPAASQTPGASKAPDASEAPSESKTPATSEAPSESKAPATSEAPSESKAPAVSQAPSESKAPAVSQAPSESKAPAVSQAPSESKAPAVSQTPTTPATGGATSGSAVTSGSSVTSGSGVTSGSATTTPEPEETPAASQAPKGYPFEAQVILNAGQSYAETKMTKSVTGNGKISYELGEIDVTDLHAFYVDIKDILAKDVAVDSSEMKISDVTITFGDTIIELDMDKVKCGQKYTDQGEKTDDYQITIYNGWGEPKDTLDLETFTGEKSLTVEFTITGLPEDKPEPTPTATPEQVSYDSTLTFSAGEAQDVVNKTATAEIKENGKVTYTVDAFELSKPDKFYIDIVDLLKEDAEGNALNVDDIEISGMKVTVGSDSDAEEITVDGTKLICGKDGITDNYRIEIYDKDSTTGTDSPISDTDWEKFTGPKALKVEFTIGGLPEATKTSTPSGDI